jgi:exosome complex exonuclease DIS3/RRP44
MKNQFTFKKIKKGNVVKMIKSKYLRDDIPCGAIECKLCDNSVKSILSLENTILILDASIILEQIDALENFEIINNCIVPQSEYMFLNEKYFDTLRRLNNIMDNRNFYLFPNEYHRDIEISNEERLKKKLRRNLMFIRTAEYLSRHFEEISNEFKIVALTNQENKNFYRSQFSHKSLQFFTLEEFANYEMKEYPDLYNYIAFSEKVSYANTSQINEDVIMESDNLGHLRHISENEMKSNIKAGNLFQGKIMFQPDILDYAVVRCYLFEKEVIINTNERLNRAMHGDIVCIEILEESQWLLKPKKTLLGEEDLLEDAEVIEDTLNTEGTSENQRNVKEKIESSPKQPVGKVRGILRRNRTQFCGTICNAADNNIKINVEHLKIKNFSIFIPVDPKYPNFLIRLNQPNIYYNKRILIKFDDWLENNPLPSGHFLKNLGDVMDIKVENEVILYEHNVDIHPFSQKIINSMPKEDIELKVSEDEFKKRIDLRDITICSIDPPGCKDIDDALHCRVLPNGNYEVGVHIADVTHYVKPGTEVDRIAAKNSNTVYMVHKRTDMLPKVLTENLCSLVGNRERLAFSVLWEVEKNSLEIIDVKFTKSVIKSKAAMTYQQANERLNDKNDNSEITISIRNLNKIAKHLRNKRIESGALILASNEMKFVVDFETNSINDISMYQTYETNSLVEEFMLLANVWVADKIFQSYPSCAVLRRHPSPKEKEIKSLQELLKNNNFSIDISNSKLLGESLDNVKKHNDKFFNKLVRIMTTRTMNQAKYFTSSEFGYEDFFHYGLAMPIYTHFTSPIRRYADVLVHRLLAAAIDVDYLPMDMSNKVKALRQMDQMNKQNRVAFFCSRDSNDLSTFIFFQNKKENVEVVIHGVDSNSVKGISIKLGIEANVQFNNLKFVDVENKIVHLSDGEQLTIFDHIFVEIQAEMGNYRREIKYNFKRKLNSKDSI